MCVCVCVYRFLHVKSKFMPLFIYFVVCCYFLLKKSRFCLFMKKITTKISVFTSCHSLLYYCWWNVFWMKSSWNGLLSAITIIGTTLSEAHTTLEIKPFTIFKNSNTANKRLTEGEGHNYEIPIRNIVHVKMYTTLKRTIIKCWPVFSSLRINVALISIAENRKISTTTTLAHHYHHHQHTRSPFVCSSVNQIHWNIVCVCTLSAVDNARFADINTKTHNHNLNVTGI